jgi:hypothetical protein
MIVYENIKLDRISNEILEKNKSQKTNLVNISINYLFR